MIIGIDYWQVLSHHPKYFTELIRVHMNAGHAVHIISAIGESRKNTVDNAVRKIMIEHGVGQYFPQVHELIFDDPKQSPELKLELCKLLEVDAFYDDRDDVCRLLNKHGITANRVTRKDNSTYDLLAEIGSMDAKEIKQKSDNRKLAREIGPAVDAIRKHNKRGKS